LGGLLGAAAASRLHESGPNLLVRPQVGGPARLEAADVARVLATPGVEAAAGVLELEAAAELVAGEDGRLGVRLTGAGEGRLPVVGVAGDLLALHPRWEVATEPMAGAEGVLVGAGAAGPHGSPHTPYPLDPLPTLMRGEGDAPAPLVPQDLAVSGTVTTGEELDRGVMVPLAVLDGVLGDGSGDPGVDRIEVRAAPGRLEATARAIEARVAGAEARPLVRVTETEARLARKLQLLVAGVGAVCLLLALATVGSATLALLDERRAEIALFLSLGYTGRWVQGLLTAELALVGLASVAAGGLLGEAGAAALARVLLGEAAALRPSLPALGAGLAAGAAAVIVVVAAAAALVRRRVERLDPAPVLQGR
ncbi:MAG TPA: FtsX-like permease family protein, partial [Thermoanaerobaculia bacterium]|nr:FtsX-like permease family protein [Thermoanaerobaculia bacterium]